MKKIIALTVGCFALLAGAAYAQDAALDMEQLAAQAITALIPVVGAVLVYLVRQVLPKLPRVSIPIIAMVLGIALDYLIAYASGGTFNPVVGAVLGAASVWLREVISTFNEHGLNS